MKKLILFLVATVLLCGFYSCNKDDSDLPSGENYLEITVNGKTYDTDNGGILGFSDRETCDEKDGFLMGVGQIETSELFFEFYINHYENLIDFETAEKGQYGVGVFDIFREDFYEGCNFDAKVIFEDYTESDHDTNLKSGGTNTITSIKRLDETSTDVNYAIEGNFSCKFLNDSGVEVSVSGKYNVVTYVLK